MQIFAGRQQSSNVGSKRSKAVQIDIDRPHPLDLIERDLIAGAVKRLSEDFLIPLSHGFDGAHLEFEEGLTLWTDKNRAKYDRDHLRFSSDLTDDDGDMLSR
jgi:hypothetical protein